MKTEENKENMVPFNQCKFSVFYSIESVLLFILSTDAAFYALKSADIDSNKFKIKPKNESKHEFYTSDTSKWNEIQITETSLNSTEYLDSIVNNQRQRNETFVPDEFLPWEKENSHHHQHSHHHYYYIRKKVNSNEMQMIYWYYDKVMAVVLGIFFGITLNLENAKVILKQPIGPSIGVFCKFILSPFLSYKLGLIFFTENISHRYDLILNGITLMGFVAVCWTILLDGNIDLSITMAIINTQLYMVLWPLWIAFGQWMLYHDTGDEIRFRIDFGYIIEPAFFIVSLYLGIIFQCICPRAKSPILPALKSMSSYYLLFYFVLLFFCLPGSTTVNLFYAGFLLSAVGYCAGWFLALAFKLPYADRIAIGCETTIQNSAQLCTTFPMVGQLFVNNMRLAYVPIDD